MNRRRANGRGWIEVVCLGVLVGGLPLSGCALHRGAKDDVPAGTFSSQAAAVAVPQDFTLPAPLPPTIEAAVTADTSSTSPQPLAWLPPVASDQASSPPVRTPDAPAPRAGLEVAPVNLHLTNNAPALGVLHANAGSFDEQVLRSDVPVLVDFYASWCGPCKRLAPTLEEVAAESPRARVVKVDIDDNPELAARYGVQSIPHLMVFKDGRVVTQEKGLVSKTRLKTMLDF